MLYPDPVRLDHATGDATGVPMPAHGDALASGGADWLTLAFRAFGYLAPDNAVTRIVSFTPCPGGSTGAKFFLDVDYARADPGLHRRLFVKFSRDFTDPRRDHPGRYEMASEARFMPLTRLPGFPIEVPAACFADYHFASGTGLVITERVAFGEAPIEPHRGKCLDWQTTPDPLPYYRATVAALARLCAAHRAGHLSPGIDKTFPFDPVAGSADPIRYSAAELEAELAYGEQFAARAPQMLPAEVRDPAFLRTVRRDALRIREHEAMIQRALTGDPRMIALCHWNAHIDNCWFHRDAGGTLHCGLIDWGRVGRITLGSALWGGLSAAHHDIWDHHLAELLDLFVDEYRAGGGPAITAQELEDHLTLHIMAMGVARVLAFPEIIDFRVPGLDRLTGPRDPAVLSVEPARNCLHVYTVFLKFWRRQDFGAALDRLLLRSGQG
ncbi:MAG: hypothetical protein KGL44_00295 [Sphingomonadales bacterium]|nr:hypothetical protein [Sphingomonadales bacterium]